MAPGVIECTAGGAAGATCHGVVGLGTFWYSVLLVSTQT